MTKAALWGVRWRSKTSFIITTVALGSFTDLFLYGLPVPLLLYILEDRLHLPATKVQSHSSSLLAAHAISTVIFCPIAGIPTDKFSGRKLPYLTGVLVLLLATILFFPGWRYGNPCHRPRITMKFRRLGLDGGLSNTYCCCGS